MTVAGQREHRPTGSSAARVLIVGAGFGGLAAMRRLARAGMQTTLIDRLVYSTFQPLLYEVASAGLALHLVTLLGGRNRISALVNMSSRYLTWQHGGGLIVGDGMTGLIAQSATADQQAISPTSTDPTPT